MVPGQGVQTYYDRENPKATVVSPSTSTHSSHILPKKVSPWLHGRTVALAILVVVLLLACLGIGMGVGLGRRGKGDADSYTSQPTKPYPTSTSR